MKIMSIKHDAEANTKEIEKQKLEIQDKMAQLENISSSPPKRRGAIGMTDAVTSKFKKSVGSQKYKAEKTATDRAMCWAPVSPQKTKDEEHSDEEGRDKAK